MITSDITIFKRNRTNPSSIEKDINNAGKIQTTNIPIQRKTLLFRNFTSSPERQEDEPGYSEILQQGNWLSLLT